MADLTDYEIEQLELRISKLKPRRGPDGYATDVLLLIEEVKRRRRSEQAR